MEQRCCVEGCGSTSRLPEHQGVSYYVLPLDEPLRAVWVRLARLSHTKDVYVCSRHFRRADFVRQRNNKYALQEHSFPSVFPWGKMSKQQLQAEVQQFNSSALEQQQSFPVSFAEFQRHTNLHEVALLAIKLSRPDNYEKYCANEKFVLKNEKGLYELFYQQPEKRRVITALKQLRVLDDAPADMRARILGLPQALDDDLHNPQPSTSKR